MKITKIKIRNLFGLKELERAVSDMELAGDNGIGKTSFIDAIRYVFSNKSSRDCIIRKGEEEGSVYIETDTGLSIDRKKRVNKADYVSVKQNGKAVSGAVEAFLREFFTTLQFNPVEFLSMDSKEQNRIILDLIDFKWDMAWIKDQFGEIVPDVDYSQNILRVLHQIQAEDGYYFMTRQDINREARNKKAFVEEIGATLPQGYNAEKWEKVDLSEAYTKLEKARRLNADIESAKSAIASVDDKIRSFDADKEIAIASAEKECATRRSQIEQSIIKLEEQIKAYKVEMKSLETKKADKIKYAEKSYEASVAEHKAKVEECKPMASKKITNVAPLEEEARTIERMKSFINEYNRMVALQQDIEELVEKSEDLTAKIEKARTLPGEILSTCKLPLADLTIEDGEPRIKGLPVVNLSDGEKLNLCVDIAAQFENNLNLLLIDGVEKLSEKNRTALYSRCKSKGVSFIATRTTSADELIITEL